MKKLMTAALVLLAATTLLSAAPKKKGPKIEKKDPVTIFDPATLTEAPKGTEIVERDGVKYLKVTCDGWDNYLDIAPIDLKGYNRFCCTMYADVENENYGYTVNLSDSGKNMIAAITSRPLGTEPTLVRVAHEVKQTWNTISKSDKAERCQYYVQGGEDVGWNPVKAVFYIGKVYAE